MAPSEIQGLIDRANAASEAGDDLEGSEEFRQIESLLGDTESDWAEIERLCIGLLGRSLDIRVAVALTAATLRDPARGLSGFRAGLTLIRTLLEKQGERMHPRVDPDAPLSALRQQAMVLDELSTKLNSPGDDYEVIARMRRLPLTLASSGALVTFRDLMILRGELENPKVEEGEDLAAKQAAFEAALAQTVLRDRGRLEAMLGDAVAALHEAEEAERIFVKLGAGVDGVPRLDLAALKDQLRRVAAPIEEALGQAAAPSAQSGSAALSTSEMSGSADASDAVPPAQAAGATSGGGRIESRADVLTAIASIQDYYKRSEPSSPVPLLLDRAKRFVNMNFVDIVEDIAGDSVENLQILFGAGTSEDADESGD